LICWCSAGVGVFVVPVGVVLVPVLARLLFDSLTLVLLLVCSLLY
jgi:hypothetical protein